MLATTTVLHITGLTEGLSLRPALVQQHFKFKVDTDF